MSLKPSRLKQNQRRMDKYIVGVCNIISRRALGQWIGQVMPAFNTCDTTRKASIVPGSSSAIHGSMLPMETRLRNCHPNDLNFIPACYRDVVTHPQQKGPHDC